MVKNLVLENISVGFKLPQSVFYAVDDVSLNLPGGNFTAIIGESGCGKSVLGQAILNILPSGVVKKGRVLYNGEQVENIFCARALINEPKLILADEPTKGLDEQVGAVVRKNLLTIKQDLHLSMLIITHDIALAQEVCDDVLVMYAGQVLEHNADIWHKPLHPYTKGFLQALPKNGLQVIPGKAPVPGESFTGCKFAARCPYSTKRCKEEKPAMQQVGDAEVRCFLYAEG